MSAEVLHVMFGPRVDPAHLEDINGLLYPLTALWWPIILRGNDDYMAIVDTLYGVLTLAGALHMADLYSDVQMLIGVAHLLNGEEV